MGKIKVAASLLGTRVSAFVLAAGFGLANPVAAAALISDGEAALGPYQGMTLMTRGIGGPLIKVVSPDQGDGKIVPVLPKPVHINVLFEDSVADTKVDMS